MPFRFNAPYQITPLPNVRPVIVGFTLFEWFIFIYLSLFSYRSIIFNSHLFHLHPLFQGQNLSVKQGLVYWYIYTTLGRFLYLCSLSWSINISVIHYWHSHFHTVFSVILYTQYITR
jgi:hypothetical protein